MNKKHKPLGSTDSNKNHKRVENVVLTCACNRDLTIDELAEAYPDRGMETLEKFLDSLNAAMKNYDIRSCLRKAHFLAQVGHESSELKYSAEVLPKGVTEEKKYGGYKGRGLMQLTLKENYVAYGKAIKQDLLGANRTRVEEPKLACDSAGWFWSVGAGESLNKYADQNDVLYITASINGGFNGYEGAGTARLKLLKNAVNAMHVKSCPQLEALFAAFPEAEKFSYESYPFTKSKAYDKLSMAYAWALWHDPASIRKGTKKDVEQAKLGYNRFLQLAPKKKKSIFKFKKTKMDEHREHAEKRIRELA